MINTSETCNIRDDLPSPSAWASYALTAESRKSAWNLFQKTLSRIGFESCSYISEMPRAESKLNDHSKLFGPLGRSKCDAWVNNACRLGRVVDLDEATIAKHPDFSAITDDAINVVRQLGLRAGWISTVYDRRKGTVSMLVIPCSLKRANQQSVVERYTPYLKSSVIYFREGLEVRRLVEGADGALLSQREEDCMAWTAAGRSAKEIGSLLGIAMSTVNEYVDHAKLKLGAANRTQASARAMLAGAVSHQP